MPFCYLGINQTHRQYRSVRLLIRLELISQKMAFDVVFIFRINPQLRKVLVFEKVDAAPRNARD